jgi:hypothetical protein
MKRTAGALVLLAGLSGCLSFPPKEDPAEKKTVAARGAAPITGNPGGYPMGPVAMPTAPAPTGPLPLSATPLALGPAGMNPGLAAATPMPAAPGVHWGPPPGAANQPGPMAGGTGAALTSATLPPAGPPPLPLPPNLTVDQSILPVVETPRPTGGSVKAPTSVATPAPMPVVLTPKAERKDTPTVITVSKNEDPERIPVNGARNLPGLPPTPTVQKEVGGDRPMALGAPMVRLVNRKQLTLNFEVKDVGPSGLSGVELWYTTDTKNWKKYDAPAQSNAYIIEVDAEGMYGLTLVARSGTGMAKEPPVPGEQPQVWVIVDTTKPAVQLGEVSAVAVPGGQTVTIRWKASDKNLARQPISLYYSERAEGPWKPIATNLENNGLYNWPLPPGMPGLFLVRVDAADMAGNIGSAESPRPMALDASVPKPVIVDVTPR